MMIELTSMPLSTATITLTVGIVAVLSILTQFYRPQSTPFLLPPGPRGWPIIGNILDLRTNQPPWVLWRNWSRQWYIGTHFLVVHIPIPAHREPHLRSIYTDTDDNYRSADIAFDLLEKRSTIYSDKLVSTTDEL